MTDKEKWNLQIAKHEKVIWNKNGPLRFHGPFGPAQLKKKKNYWRRALYQAK